MRADTSFRLSQTNHRPRHRRLTFDAKKVLTLWTLLVGAVAVLLWGLFSFPKKITVTRLSKNKTCDDEVRICIGGWNKLRRNCFSHVNHKNSWVTATEYCKLHDATLALFNDKTELETVMKQMHEMQTYWIGLDRKNALGIWFWTNGSKYNNLYEIQDHGPCAFIHQYGIDSTQCDELKEYICTREGKCI
ncbi:C-type lectin domain family 2 member F-like isoform X2 [Arvicanthis niloticus]|uniref:C-type lectin domain family 2 member F-like isoform X2 n=1 Tax=Arvicanthis niloticus TaxID=61156 RepID=UPI001486CC6E|nr:C-type lectin domain family 2 member F-like isoform X2 [Arvicanthis niloticus]